MHEQPEFATPADTRASFTRLSARGYTQIRHVLVQLPDTEPNRASILGALVHGRKHHALLLYILLLTAWPWLHDRREPLQAAVWLRALDAVDVPNSPKALTWSPSSLSRAWAALADAGLVATTREARLVRVLPRREDAREDYCFPRGRNDRWNAYFAVPDEFWNDGWFARLSLPALAMLLVVAKETNGKDEVWLTYDNCNEWYGIKPKSAQKGVTELIAVGLLHKRVEMKKAPLSPTGQTTRTWYSLTGEFGHQSRAARQKRATKETRKRAKGAKPMRLVTP